MARLSLSDLKSFLAYESSTPYWIGIDVHKCSYHIALLRHDQEFFTWSAPASPEKLIETISDFKILLAGVCYESGPTGFTLARCLQHFGYTVLVAASVKIPRSVSSGSKTDRLDCMKLAQFAAKGLIRPIAIPSESEEDQRSLLRRRNQLVDSIRKNKQRIKSLFLYHGFKTPDAIRLWSSKSSEALYSMSLPDDLKSTLISQVRELDFLKSELKIVTDQLKVIVRRKEHNMAIKALTSVPGVGEVVATSFILEIFDPSRFKRGEELSNYLGLAPQVHHSGEKTPRGYITPVGQTRLRSQLIEAAWIWKSRDEYAEKIYKKLVSKTGVPQKAITALARKLSIILWRLSIEQRVYRSELSI